MSVAAALRDFRPANVRFGSMLLIKSAKEGVAAVWRLLRFTFSRLPTGGAPISP